MKRTTKRRRKTAQRHLGRSRGMAMEAIGNVLNDISLGALRQYEDAGA